MKLSFFRIIAGITFVSLATPSAKPHCYCGIATYSYPGRSHSPTEPAVIVDILDTHDEQACENACSTLTAAPYVLLTEQTFKNLSKGNMGHRHTISLAFNESYIGYWFTHKQPAADKQPAAETIQEYFRVNASGYNPVPNTFKQIVRVNIPQALEEVFQCAENPACVLNTAPLTAKSRNQKAFSAKEEELLKRLATLDTQDS